MIVHRPASSLATALSLQSSLASAGPAGIAPPAPSSPRGAEHFRRARPRRTAWWALAALAGLSMPACGGTSASFADAADVVAAPALHTFTSDPSGFDTHSFWLDTGREVVVFDAQFTPALAEQLLASIRAATTSPVRFVVVTHPNPDKLNGAAVFQALGAKVVASRATAAAIPDMHAYKRAYFTQVAKSFTDSSYPAEAHVDLTFEGNFLLPTERGHIELHELRHAGVSSTQTVAWLPAQRALVVGDLVHHGAHAWLEGGIVRGVPAPDLVSWQAALEELRAYPGATVYGGRGEAAPVEAAVDSMSRYLTTADRVVGEYVRDLPRAGEILRGPSAGPHWAALRTRMEAAYPEYELSYLVEYGVYGLALAKAP